VWQTVTDQGVGHRAGKCRHEGRDEGCVSRTDERDDSTGTGAAQRPAEAEYVPPILATIAEMMTPYL
jgi:hypothetical protein